MSDTETPEQSASTPTPQPTPKAKGRGRGRGKKPAVPKKEAPKPAPAVGTGRRGRFKQFGDDKTQASYERQRELKAQYAALANAVKPALQDLTSRSVRKLTGDADYHTRVPEFDVVNDHLQRRLDDRLAVANRKQALDKKMAIAAAIQQRRAVREIFENGYEDLEDRFLDAQLHRLDILEYLHDHELPVDLVDGAWTYKQISDKEASEFGIYEVYIDGHLVPYPQLIEGTEAYALRQAAWAEPLHKEAAAAPPAATSTRPKRKAKDQPDGQPSSKRTAGDVAPANHIAGIMSAQHAPVEDESNESTPIPEGPVTADQRDPPLPAKASEPDEYGCRQVNRPAAKNGAMIANRIIVPPAFQFDDDEIGYRDSTNSAKHGATVAKRGKYFGKPNSNTWHYDPLLARWDARLVEDSDMDKELVEKHAVHPRYGYFLPTSKNEAEPPKPEADPMRPTVFLTPSGQTIHTSRIVPAAKTEAAVQDKPFQDRMAEVLSAVCDENKIPAEDIEGPELLLLKQLQAEYAEQRVKAESIREQQSESVEDTPASSPFPANESALNIAGLEDLIQAAKAVEAEPREVKTAEEKHIVVQPPTPARPATRAYDAIRDVFGDAEPAVTEPPTPVIAHKQIDITALAILANASTGDYTTHAVDTTMADASLMREVPVDGPPHHHVEPSYSIQPMAAGSHMPMAHGNSAGWAEARLGSPAPDGRVRLSIEHQNQIPPARPVEMSHMRSSIDATNDARRQSIYPEHNAPPPYNEQHMPPPHPQQHYMTVDPMIDPRLYSAPMEAQGGHHDYHNAAYNQPQQPYHMSGMSMQGGPITPAPAQHQQSGSAPRMPFTNPPQDRSSPLPPLRPSRGRKSAPAAPESLSMDHQQAQQQPPPPYMNTNSGSFYPPGPPRSYHNGFTSEQPGMPMMPQYSSYSGSQGPPQPPAQPSSYAPQGMSPTYPSIAPVQSPPSLQFVQQQPNEPPMRSRAGSGSSTPSSGANSRYPKLAPAPLPPHRVGWPQGPELRTVQYDYKENIKDYAPTEPPPRRGPVQIRGWNINNTKVQRQRAEDHGDERRGSR